MLMIEASLTRLLHMLSMLLNQYNAPLQPYICDIPQPEDNQVLIAFDCCGVCRTDLHLIAGELSPSKLPIIPGHQVVGHVVTVGKQVTSLSMGDKVGVPWLASSCQVCDYCIRHQENLCSEAQFTGYHLNGGFAEYYVADAEYVLKLPEHLDALSLAPLLCAGLIGYRAWKKIAHSRTIGLYGFGVSAHIVMQIALQAGQEVYAYTRVGDTQAQQWAYSLGATWAVDTTQSMPDSLDDAIIFAPVGELIPCALTTIHKGGMVVCAGIYMSEVPAMPYALLWGERSLCSVANLTRQDGQEFLGYIEKNPIHTTIEVYSLSQANETLQAFKSGQITGAAVLQVLP